MKNLTFLILIVSTFGFPAAFAHARTVDVVITEYAFVPRIVTIQSGDRIRFVNHSPLPEQPDSMPHGLDNLETKAYRVADYPEIERARIPISPNESSTTEPLVRAGWWGYHNHSAGSFWNGLIIIPNPVTKVPNEAELRSLIPQTELIYGSRGEEVRKLQKLLAYNSAIYPEGIVSGYYGPLTKQAVQRFQERYGLGDFARIDKSRKGILDAETRAKLRDVFGASVLTKTP